MQSRCHIKYNVFPFPSIFHFPSSTTAAAAAPCVFFALPPSLSPLPPCSSPLFDVMARGVAAPPLNFHAGRGTLTLGPAVVRKLCEVQAVLFFLIAPVSRKRVNAPSPSPAPPSSQLSSTFRSPMLQCVCGEIVANVYILLSSFSLPRWSRRTRIRAVPQYPLSLSLCLSISVSLSFSLVLAFSVRLSCPRLLTGKRRRGYTCSDLNPDPLA